MVGIHLIIRYFKYAIWLIATLSFSSNVMATECVSPNTDGYVIHEGDFILEQGEMYPPAGGSENLHVIGKVKLRRGSQFNGNIYATQKIRIAKKVEVNGNVFSKRNVRLGNKVVINGNVSSRRNIRHKNIYTVSGELCAKRNIVNITTSKSVDTPVVSLDSSGYSFKYDNKFGLVSEINGPRTDVHDIVRLVYEENTGYLSEAYTPIGRIKYQNYNLHGLPETIVDANGVSSYLTYTEEGWLESSSKAGLTTSYQYDNLGQTRFVVAPGNNTTEFVYNSARKLRFIKYANGTQKEIQYDAMGNVTFVSYTAQGKTTVASNYEYDELGRLTDVIYENAKSSIQYDVNNNPEKNTNGYEASSTSQYDSLNRLTKYIGEIDGTINYSYNAHDELVSVTDGNGGVTEYEYDDLGRVKKLTSPDAAITTYQRDGAGNPTEIIDARGQRVILHYDELNRVVEKQYEDARNEDVLFRYDFIANGRGKIQDVKNNNALIAFKYESLGRVVEQENTLFTANAGEQFSVIQYGYDSVYGTLNTTTYPSGITITFDKNTYGEVSGIQLSGNGVDGKNVVSNISYNVLGNVESLTYGNDTTLTRTFNSDGQPIAQTVTGVWDLTYGYDQNRNISEIINTLNSIENQTFSYYFNNSLQTSADNVDTTNFTYDDVGNRLTQSNLTVNDTYQYILQSNKLENIDAHLFTYDEAGNTLTSDLRNHNYTYNAEGRLASVTGHEGEATYHYNAFGERVIKEVGNDTYLYFYNEQGQLLETQYYQGSQQVSAKMIIWLDDMPVAQVEVNELSEMSVIYIHADHLNTPRKATNGDGVLVWQWQSDAFGDGLPNEDVDQNQQLTSIDLRFPGQIFDAESGLYYNYYRYYDPLLGRYITSDPIGLRGGINTFAYVGGNPVGLIDPKGLYWFKPDDHPYTVGRELTIVEPGPGEVGGFLDSYGPAWHTTGYYHDGLVDAATEAGIPDVIINIPTIPVVYVFSLGLEITNSALNIFGFDGVQHEPNLAEPDSEKNCD